MGSSIRESAPSTSSGWSTRDRKTCKPYKPHEKPYEKPYENPMKNPINPINPISPINPINPIDPVNPPKRPSTSQSPNDIIVGEGVGAGGYRTSTECSRYLTCGGLGNLHATFLSSKP